MNKRHYEHTLPNIRGSLSNTYICSPLPDKWCIFAVSNFRIMENYIKKAADAFLVERPYGMRVDYRKKGFVLFNRNLNVLGNAEHARLEELPLERFNVEEIPLDGEIVEEHAGFTVSDCSTTSCVFDFLLRCTPL